MVPAKLALAALFLLAAQREARGDGGPCAGLDPVLAGSSFVLVSSPAAGERIASGTTIRGCSRTREGNFSWRLIGRDGRELAAGSASGGGLAGAAIFEFRVDFDLGLAERGSLELLEPRTTAESFPPPATVLPFVLAAGVPKLPLFGRFLGSVPCADCAGIRTELALYGDFGSGPRQYVLVETYLGSRDGDRRQESRGDWQFTPGAGELARSIVVQLAGGGAEPRNYLVDGGDLVQLDRAGGRINSKLDYRLKRQP